MNGNFGAHSTFDSSHSQHNPIYIEDYWDFLEFLRARKHKFFVLQNDIDLSMLKTSKYGLFPEGINLDGRGRRLINLKLTAPICNLRINRMELTNIIFDNLKSEDVNLKHPVSDLNFEKQFLNKITQARLGTVDNCVFILNDEWLSSEINFITNVKNRFCLYIAPNKTATLPIYDVPPGSESSLLYNSNDCAYNFFKTQNYKIPEQAKNKSYYGGPHYVYEDTPNVGTTTHSNNHLIKTIPNNQKTNVEFLDERVAKFLFATDLFELKENIGYTFKIPFKGKFLFKVQNNYYTVDKNLTLKQIETNGLTEEQLVTMFGFINLNIVPQEIFSKLQNLGNVELKTLGNFAQQFTPTIEQLNYNGATNKQIINLTNTNINKVEV